ncbi:MAG: putative bifunctional diguanylate cyclase/phosphodiesterase [Pseudomonadota bacterium]
MPTATPKSRNPRLKIVGLYLVFGIIWILFSDHLLGLLTDASHEMTMLQTAKGWFFVAITSLLLFHLIGYYRNQEIKQLQAVRQRDERLALAHAVTGIGVWEWDLSRGITLWSQEVEQLYGIPPGSFDGHYETWLAMVHPTDRERVRERVEQWFTQPGTFSLEYRIRLPSGDTRWLLSHGATTYSTDGKPHKLLGINMDITERKQAERHLHRFETVFRSSRDAIVITDAQGVALSINPAFHDLTGYQEAEIVGHSLSMLKSGYHDREFYRQMWAAIEQHDGWSGEVWNRDKEARIHPVWLSISAVRDKEGKIINYVAILSDLAQLKHSEAELEHLSNHDPLTDLPNRRLLNARLEHGIDQARRHRYGLAVMLLDIDRFKDINDSLGLPTGDALLQELARRVSGCVRREDTVARLGGDELLVVLDEVRSPHSAAEAAQKILDALTPPFLLDGHELFITASIGISLYPENGDTPERLIRNADAAVYRAKDQGRNRTEFYSESLSQSSMERLSLITGLRHAIENSELVLHYQPQLNLSTGKIAGVEALVRWHHPEQGLIPPDNFIPIAESTGLIGAIGDWVLEEACRQMHQWHSSGIKIPRVAVNLSARQLSDSGLAERVASALERHDLVPSQLELELTETAIMADPVQASATLETVARMGVEMAVDDFGTGYSSLAYLQRLHVHRLKIDRTFVDGLPDDLNSAAICRAVIAMAHSLGMETIAEGIEEKPQRDYLESEACTMGQGWYFAKAMPAPELEQWLTERDTH